MNTKLNILLRNSFIPILFLSLLLSGTGDALAQFNPKKQAVSLQKIADTVIKVSKPKTELKFELYSDAYDSYLKKLRSMQRNNYIFKPGLTINQVGYTNWQKGGDSYYSIQGSLNFEHNYKAPVFSISTRFDAKYGLMRTTDETKKNFDYFEFTTTPSWNISRAWKLAGSLKWRSQFSKSYDYPKDKDKIWKSSFMSPGVINISGGFEYVLPNNNPVSKSGTGLVAEQRTKLKILISPIAGQMTFVLNDSLSRKGGLGINPEVDKNPKFKASIGSALEIDFSTKFAKEKIIFSSELYTFYSYVLAPTMDWKNTIEFKFTNVFSARIFAHLIYNDQINTPRAQDKKDIDLEGHGWDYLQINQSVGIGVIFNISSKKHKPIKESTITRSRLRYSN